VLGRQYGLSQDASKRVSDQCILPVRGNRPQLIAEPGLDRVERLTAWSIVEVVDKVTLSHKVAQQSPPEESMTADSGYEDYLR
jgi:hypothetical protein